MYKRSRVQIPWGIPDGSFFVVGIVLEFEETVTYSDWMLQVT